MALALQSEGKPAGAEVVARPEVPDRPIEAFPVFRLWGRCSRDANGSYVASDFQVLLDEEGVEDAGERAAWFELADQIDAEAAAVKQERHEREMEKLESRGR